MTSLINNGELCVSSHDGEMLTLTEDIVDTISKIRELRNEDKTQEAEQMTRVALEDSPDHWLLWQQLGHIHIEKQEITEALDVFQKCTELAPDEFTPWINLGYVRKEMGDYEAAITATRKAMDRASRDSEKNLANYNFACYSTLLGRHEIAIDYLRKAVQSDPSMKEWARNDDDFAEIRSDAKFIELTSTD